jgi:hypothetical protein
MPFPDCRSYRDDFCISEPHRARAGRRHLELPAGAPGRASGQDELPVPGGLGLPQEQEARTGWARRRLHSKGRHHRPPGEPLPAPVISDPESCQGWNGAGQKTPGRPIRSRRKRAVMPRSGWCNRGCSRRSRASPRSWLPRPVSLTSRAGCTTCGRRKENTRDRVVMVEPTPKLVV